MKWGLLVLKRLSDLVALMVFINIKEERPLDKRLVAFAFCKVVMKVLKSRHHPAVGLRQASGEAMPCHLEAAARGYVKKGCCRPPDSHFVLACVVHSTTVAARHWHAKRQ